MKVKNADLNLIINFYNKLMNHSLANLDKAELVADDYLKLEEAGKKVTLLTKKIQEKFKPKDESDNINKLQFEANQEYFKLLEKTTEIESITISKKDLKELEVTPLEILTLKKYNILTD
jgi:hypothetical protein